MIWAIFAPFLLALPGVPMKKRVLFLCTGNSARSQMAEALLRHLAGDRFEVYSAGTRPEGVDPRTIEALARFNVDSSGLCSKPVSEFTGQPFDYVITLCDKASQECGTFPGAGQQLHWDFEDPKSRGGLKPFDTTLKEINDRLKMFLLLKDKEPRQP